MSFEAIFDRSYKIVLSHEVNGMAFFDTFYENFINASEAVRKKFENTDMTWQKQMLKKSFYSLFVFYTTGNADQYLYKIAKSHGPDQLDIPSDLYDLWQDMLIKTVKAFDPDYTNETGLAWRLILAPGITYLKFKHSKS